MLRLLAEIRLPFALLPTGETFSSTLQTSKLEMVDILGGISLVRLIIDFHAGDSDNDTFGLMRSEYQRDIVAAWWRFLGCPSDANKRKRMQ